MQKKGILTKRMISIFAVLFVVCAIMVGVTVVSQSYVKDYNIGNDYFEKEDYAQAVAAYEEALKQHPPKEKECKIRINLALSMVIPMDEEAVERDVDQVIETLEDARDVLLAKECATDDDDGHNDEAQTLKNEIDDYLEQLKNGGGAGEDPEEDDPEESNPENDNPETEEIREALQNLQQQGVAEYIQELDYMYYLGHYEYDMGASW